MNDEFLTDFFLLVKMLSLELSKYLILQKLLDSWSLIRIEIQHFYCQVNQLYTLFLAFSKVLLDWFFANVNVVEYILCDMAF